jgi:hypothetical protein
MSQGTNQYALLCLLLAGFLLGSFFYPEDGGDVFLRNVQSIFSGLHGVISQKIELFIP